MQRLACLEVENMCFGAPNHIAENVSIMSFSKVTQMRTRWCGPPSISHQQLPTINEIGLQSKMRDVVGDPDHIIFTIFQR